MGKKSAKSSIASNDSKKPLKEFKVRSLNDNIEPFKVSLHSNALGSELFDAFCNEHICKGGFVEKDYFGLRYTDSKHQRQWLELDKDAYKQMKKSTTLGLSFRVKHYPKDPNSELTQAISKYLFYLQIRRDLTQGRLICPSPERESEIGALIYQAEIGDSPIQSVDDFKQELTVYTGAGSLEKTRFNYVSDVNVLFDETIDKKLKMIKKHIEYRGLSKQEAESDLLRIVSTFPTYGIDPFNVIPLQDIDGIKKKDINKNIYLGLTYDGIKSFVHTKENHLYKWDDINDIQLDGKKFIITHKQEVLKFECENDSVAIALWKWSLDRKSFFTLKDAQDAKVFKSKRGLFKKAKSFKFAGHSRTELENTILNSDSIPQPDFTRTASFRRSKFIDELPSELKHRATLPTKSRAKLSSLINEQLGKTGREENTLESVKGQPATKITGADLNKTSDFEKKDFDNENMDTFEPITVSASNVVQSSAPPLSVSDSFEARMNTKYTPSMGDVPVKETSIDSAADAVHKIDSELDRHDRSEKKVKIITNGDLNRIPKQAKSTPNSVNKIPEAKMASSHSAASTIGKLAALSFLLLFILAFVLVMESKSLDPNSFGVEYARTIQKQPVVKEFSEKVYQPAKETMLRLVSNLKGS